MAQLMKLRAGVLAGGLTLAVTGGCETGSAVRNVPVTYVFENVRSDARSDEWTRIRSVLIQNSVGTPTIKAGKARSLGSAKLSSYEVALVAPSLKSIDDIQAGIEGLEASDMRFTLVNVALGYRSNAVAAGVQTKVNGITTPGYTVRLHTGAGRPAQTVVASRTGAWAADVDVSAGTPWVYGVSEDPAGRDRPTYFRVSLITGLQERVDQAEFMKMFGPGADPKAAPAPAASDVGEQRVDPNLAEIEKRRKAEDEAFRKRVEAEDAVRRKRNER